MTDAKPESRHPSLLGELGARLGEDRDRQVRFLGEVGAGLSGLRQAERRRRRDFFAQVSPRLASARALERELDRLMDIATRSIPIIDEVEGTSR